MWATFLALGTIGFWIFAGVVCLLLIAAVEYEKPGWATLSLIVTGLVLWLFGNVNILALAATDPLLTLGLLAGYFAVGAVWSLAKWWFYVRRQREKYYQLRTKYLESQDYSTSGPIPDELRSDWQRRAYAHNKPQVRENKGRILTWMIYWPWSFVWTILNDPVKRLFKNIFNAMRAIFQKVADSAYKDVEDDFSPPKERPQSWVQIREEAANAEYDRQRAEAGKAAK